MPQTRNGATIVAVLLAWLWTDALRVWLPSVLFVVGDAGDTPATTLGAIAFTVALPPLALGLLALRWPAPAWASAVSVAAVGRVANHLADGGMPQFLSSSVTVMATTVGLGILAATRDRGAGARLGFVVGMALSSAIQAAAGGVDVLWRTDARFLLTSLLLATVTVLASQTVDVTERHPPGPDQAAWPWWMLGPVTVLFLLLVAAPGRVALATDWPDGVVAGVLVGFCGLLVLGCGVVRGVAPRAGGPASGLLVLVATVAALGPMTRAAVGAQALLALGLGGLVGSAEVASGSSPRSRAAAGTGWLVAFVALGFAVYAPYDLPLPYPPRAVLLLTAGILTVAGLFAGRPTTSLGPRVFSVMRRSAVVALVTLVVTSTAMAALSGGAPRPAAHDPDAEDLTIVLYNVHMGFDVRGRLSIHRVADALAGARPDVVVLNEVDRGWLTTGNRDGLRILQRRLGMPYVFAPAADEVWGNAVLSRWPIAESSHQRLPRGADAMARNQVTVVIEVDDDRLVAVIGTHLSHVEDQGNTRVPQARSVVASVARFRERGLPVIVAGDLNATPGSVELTTFGAFVTSAIPDGVPTWPSTSPEAQIDHILVSDDLVVTGHGVFERTLSDHLGLVARLELP